MNIAEIEATILDAIKRNLPYLKFAGNYNGQLDETQISQFALNFPAVLIYTEGMEYSHRSWPLLWQDLTINVLVCDKNLRGNEAARHGDLTSPGIYKMLEDVFTALFNQTLDMNIQPFDIVSEEALLNSNRMAVYMAKYKIQTAKN